MTVDENVKKVFVTGGKTLVRHSQNGDRIYVCGTNHVLKVFNARDSEKEPETLDIIDKVTSFDLSPDSKFGVVTSSNGECYSYDLDKLSSKAQLITKSPLALRDATFTHSGSSILCGGADGDLRFVDLKDLDSPPKIHNTADQVTAISYNHTGDLAAVSLSNGDVVILSYTSFTPSKVHLLENIVMEKKGMLDDDDDDDEEEDEIDNEQGDDSSYSDQIMKLATTKCEWHTNGDLLAVPTKTREIQVYDRADLSKERFSFKGASSHDKPIISLKWSPNGNYLASIGLDNKLIIWGVKSKKQVKTLALPMTCCSLSWGKNKDKDYELIVGSNNGCIIKFKSIVSQYENSGRDDFFDELDGFSDNESESGNKSKSVADKYMLTRAEEAEDDEEEEEEEEGEEGTNELSKSKDGRKADAVDDEDDEEEDESMLYGHEDDFIVDDDGSGYVEKRRIEHGSGSALKRSKFSYSHSQNGSSVGSLFDAKEFALKPFSQGGTPWNNGRRYISINPHGYVWSVKQEGFNTVTVSFFDRAINKEYHFRDGHNFDIASMNDEGIVFASSGKQDGRSKLVVAYRSHSNPNKSWEKRIHSMNNKEFITSVSLSNSNIFVCTSLGYIRKFSLFGKVERIEKNAPIVACINNDKYVFTVTSSSIGSLSFNVQDLDGKYLQRNEPLPLDLSSGNLRRQNHAIKGLFFSLDGDPCIVGNDDILLVLSRWRTPLQATWIPLLDTREGVKVIAAGENVKCWPLGLFKDQFSFIAIRGGDYPTFPLSLPAEISVKIPLTYKDSENNKKKNKKSAGSDGENEDDEDENMDDEEPEEDPEEELVRCITLGELLNDAISNDDVLDSTAEERLNEFSIMYDRTLLKQFGQVCSDSSIAESLDIVSKLRDDRALQAARLIAERAGNGPLSRKITELQDLRMQFAEEE